MVTTRTMLIGPREAAEMLAKVHPDQRPVNAGRVAYYAAQMLAGQWRDSNDAICRDAQGYLVNGRTRLSAVIASGQACWFDVKDGLTALDVLHFDDGRARGARDTLRFASHTSEHAADVVRLLTVGPQKRSTRANPEDLAATYQKYRESLAFCGSRNQTTGWTAAARAVCVLVHHREPTRRHDVERFADLVRSQAEPLPTEPHGVTARALRTALLRRGTANQAPSQLRDWRLTQTALRAYLDGRDLMIVRPSKEYWSLNEQEG